MGGSSSKLGAVPGAIKDTTLRSVVFGLKDLDFIKTPSGQMILKNQVTAEKFTEYENLLKMMARYSRLVYCDSGIMRKAILDPSNLSPDNIAFNGTITRYDKEFISQKRQLSTAQGSIEGRPMQSYLIDLLPNPPSTRPFAHYVSSPADLTFVIVSGSKVPGLLETDAVISFKGSSTVDNFKHDLMSQFTPVKLEENLPPGLKMSSTTTGNLVPGSFLSHITDSWEFLDGSLKQFNPTRLFVTGHSLGGAYATLFAFVLAEVRSNFSSIQSIHLVTVGAPTVLSDLARNTFNAHLDSGNLTLDRVVASGSVTDFIPKIPVGFSHPGFQPLNTEFQPELKTGRAYNFETIRKVFQTGGALVLGFTQAKRDYGNQTLTHAPNLVRIKTNFNPFAHAGYFGLTWLGGFRMMGMKNPGFKTNTFVSDLYEEGVTFSYNTPVTPPKTAETPDAVSNESIESLATLAPKEGGRRTYRKKLKTKKKSLRNGKRGTR